MTQSFADDSMGMLDIHRFEKVMCELVGAKAPAQLVEAVLTFDGGTFGSPMFLTFAAAITSDRVVVGRANIRFHSRWLFWIDANIERVKVAEFPITLDRGLTDSLGIETVLGSPKKIRKTSEWIDGGDPTIVVWKTGKRREYRLELLSEDDPAHAFYGEVSMVVLRMLGEEIVGFSTD